MTEEQHKIDMLIEKYRLDELEWKVNSTTIITDYDHEQEINQILNGGYSTNFTNSTNQSEIDMSNIDELLEKYSIQDPEEEEEEEESIDYYEQQK